ncbi:MAG: hypothetical protein ACFCU2_05085 [Acidimicrobiia bacterium]
MNPVNKADGFITRDDLPEGLAALVTEESIAAANLPVFATARQGYGSDARFVAQIDYQLEFRSKVDFMSSEYEHIAQLMSERPENMGSEQMGLYMAEAEVAEMKRRDALGDSMPSVVTAVTGIRVEDSPEGILPDYGPIFGGIWQDQLDGGRIVLAVVDATSLDIKSLEDLVDGSANLKIVEQPFTYNEIENYRLQLDSELQALGIARDIAAVRSDRGRLLEVRVADPVSLPESFGVSVPRSAFDVVIGEPIQEAGYPNTTHSLADQQPGLRIAMRTSSSFVGYCTWGFNGHTSTFNYMVYAGHCNPGTYKNSSGYVGSNVKIWQNNSSSRVLTPSNPFLHSVDNSTYDGARMQSGYANDNCYHGDTGASSPSPHCGWPMSARAIHNSWEVGSDRTCASLGNSGVYKCGYIVELNAPPNRVRVDMSVVAGDSGSGFKWDYRIDGILTDRSTTQAFFQTAYHVQVALGNGYFYFNCASGKKTYSDPSNWGVCPAVDA